MLKHIDLFAGIGGFSLALERMCGGFKTVAAVEIDPYAAAVYRKNFPSVPVHDDVRSFDARRYESDIITGGFPCQPTSYAGERRGAKDDRWLWPEMFKIIKDARPRWVIAENPPGIITMGLNEVLSDLESEGYSCAGPVIPACAVDAPHRRDRVWITAYAGGEQHKSGGDAEQGTPTQKLSNADAMADAASERCDASWCAGQEISPPGALEGSAGRDSSGRREWPPEPGVDRVAYGIPSRVDRIKCLGNSICPQVAAQIGFGILAVEAATRAT